VEKSGLLTRKEVRGRNLCLFLGRISLAAVEKPSEAERTDGRDSVFFGSLSNSKIFPWLFKPGCPF
jgi:hypothetical protein